jgi:hypothetical protein
VSSLNYIAPMARSVLASIRPVDAAAGAFRNGGGVPYADYGVDMHEAQAAFTRPLFENLLGKEWLPSVPEIHERLLADPPAAVADGRVRPGAARASRSRARTRRSASTGSTPTTRRSRAHAKTSTGAASKSA